MSFREIFDWSAVGELRRQLKAMLQPVEQWPINQKRELLPLDDAERLAREVWGTTAEDRLAALRTAFEEHEILPATKARLLDDELGLLLASGVLDQLALHVLSGQSTGSSVKERIVALLSEHSNPAIVRAYVMAGDMLTIAQQDEEEDYEALTPNSAIMLYEAAVNSASYPRLLVELAPVLLHKVPVTNVFGESEALGNLLGQPVIYPSECDLISDELLGSPALPECRDDLLRLALSCYASAYGFAVHAAGRDDREIPDAELFLLATCALDGMRLLFHERDKDELNELVYYNYEAWRQVRLNDHSWDEVWDDAELAARFAYSFGVARGSPSRAAVLGAQEILTSVAAKSHHPAEPPSVPGDEWDEWENKTIKRCGTVWEKIPPHIQDLLINAEYQASTHHPREMDRSPAIAQYSRALETIARETFGPMLCEFGVVKRRVTDATLGELAAGLVKAPNSGRPWEQLCGAFPGQEGNLRSIAGKLQLVNGIGRIRAVHGSDSFGGGQVRRIQKLIFDSSPADMPLIDRLAELFGG